MLFVLFVAYIQEDYYYITKIWKPCIFSISTCVAVYLRVFYNTNNSTFHLEVLLFYF